MTVRNFLSSFSSQYQEVLKKIVNLAMFDHKPGEKVSDEDIFDAIDSGLTWTDDEWTVFRRFCPNVRNVDHDTWEIAQEVFYEECIDFASCSDLWEWHMNYNRYEQ